LEILHVLWRIGPASLGSIHDELRQQRQVAKTTVATMLTLMLEKKLVRRRQSARGYRWSAAVTREETAGNMVGKLIAGVFEGSAGRMVAHLVQAGHITEKELAELSRLVEKQRRAEGRKKKKK
jgi:predicted transcriptional regulator